MYIAAHKRKNRNELLFVFNFATEEEMHNLIKDWKSHSIGLMDLTEKGYCKEFFCFFHRTWLGEIFFTSYCA